MPKHTEKNEHSKKIQMYLTAAVIIIMIFAAWLINIKNVINHNLSLEEEEPLIKEIEKISRQFNNIIIDTENIKKELTNLSTPTNTAESLQGGPSISPEQLDNMIEKLKIETASSTATTTPDFLKNL